MLFLEIETVTTAQSPCCGFKFFVRYILCVVICFFEIFDIETFFAELLLFRMSIFLVISSPS